MSLIALLCPYFLASIIAAAKEKKKSRAIFFVDLLFGWTVIGWIVAIMWALIKDVSVSRIGQSSRMSAIYVESLCATCDRPRRRNAKS